MPIPIEDTLPPRLDRVRKREAFVIYSRSRTYQKASHKHWFRTKTVKDGDKVKSNDDYRSPLRYPKRYIKSVFRKWFRPVFDAMPVLLGAPTFKHESLAGGARRDNVSRNKWNGIGYFHLVQIRKAVDPEFAWRGPIRPPTGRWNRIASNMSEMLMKPPLLSWVKRFRPDIYHRNLLVSQASGPVFAIKGVVNTSMKATGYSVSTNDEAYRAVQLYLGAAGKEGITNTISFREVGTKIHSPVNSGTDNTGAIDEISGPGGSGILHGIAWGIGPDGKNLKETVEYPTQLPKAGLEPMTTERFLREKADRAAVDAAKKASAASDAKAEKAASFVAPTLEFGRTIQFDTPPPTSPTSNN